MCLMGWFARAPEFFEVPFSQGLSIINLPFRWSQRKTPPLVAVHLSPFRHRQWAVLPCHA